MKETTSSGIGNNPGVEVSGVTTTTGIGVPTGMKYLEEINRLRAQLTASQAEVERLRGIIRKAEWEITVGTVYTQYECPVCGCFNFEDEPREHFESCPFYQWEGGAK